MECAFHSGQSASDHCSVCNKALCRPCVNRFDPPMCRQCFRADIYAWGRRLDNRLRISAIIFFAVLAFMFVVTSGTSKGISIFTSLKFAYGFMSLYCGMIALRNLNTHNSSTLFGAYMSSKNFIASFVIAIFIGPFIAPFFLYKTHKDYKKSQHIKQMLDDEAVCVNNASGL